MASESIFRLTVISGAGEYVERELLSKFPQAEIVHREKTKIDFWLDNRSIEDFRFLMSPLRIQDKFGKDFDLFKRSWRKAFVPAGINPSLAYVMCQLADLTKDDVLLDPFCGGGTIPITAYVNFKPKKVLAADISGKAIDITKLNVEVAKIPSKKFVLIKSDVTKLKIPPKSVSKVITNMPFGIRVGTHEMNVRLYSNFREILEKILTQDGLALVLTAEKKLLREVMEGRFKVEEILPIDQGGLKPSVFKLTKNKLG